MDFITVVNAIGNNICVIISLNGFLDFWDPNRNRFTSLVQYKKRYFFNF